MWQQQDNTNNQYIRATIKENNTTAEAFHSLRDNPLETHHSLSRLCDEMMVMVCLEASRMTGEEEEVKKGTWRQGKGLCIKKVREGTTKELPFSHHSLSHVTSLGSLHSFLSFFLFLSYQIDRCQILPSEESAVVFGMLCVNWVCEFVK